MYYSHLSALQIKDTAMRQNQKSTPKDWDFNVSKTKKGCRKFVKRHGQPSAFVTKLFTHPAQTAAAFELERQYLISELDQADACEHVVRATLDFHVRVLGNSRHHATIKAIKADINSVVAPQHA